MAFINQGIHIGTVGLSSTIIMEFNIKTQGNADGTIPDHGQAAGGQSAAIENTLTTLPDYQTGETVTGSTNSYTASVVGVSLLGTSEFANSVGGGVGGPGEQHGYGGGSGGGGSTNNIHTTTGGFGVAGQGNTGGLGGDRQGTGGGASGGGGGAGAVGGAGQTGGTTAGAGGNGAANYYRDGNTSGTTAGVHIYAGGGGGAGGGGAPISAAGGTGGGGSNGSGTVNTGGGGGTGTPIANGGSGIVVVRYDTSQSSFTVTGGTEATYTTGSTNYKSHTFTTSGALTVVGTGNVDAMIVSGGGGSGGHGGSAEGGFFRGGGGAGGMHVTTAVGVVAGTYAVAVGAGGTGSPGSGNIPLGTGNLSWITPRRILNVSGATGDYVVGETITGGTTGATGDVISYQP